MIKGLDTLTFPCIYVIVLRAPDGTLYPKGLRWKANLLNFQNGVALEEQCGAQVEEVIFVRSGTVKDYLNFPQELEDRLCGKQTSKEKAVRIPKLSLQDLLNIEDL